MHFRVSLRRRNFHELYLFHLPACLKESKVYAMSLDAKDGEKCLMQKEFLQQGLVFGKAQRKSNHLVLMQETNSCLKRKKK
jgi:hypothetical protein